MGLLSWMGGKSAADATGAVPNGGSVEALDFATAAAAHNAWRARFEAAVKGESTEPFTSQVASADDLCLLGRWLHGVGKTRFGHVPAFETLLATHREFHQHAGRILELSLEGNLPEARKRLEYGDYRLVSHKVRAQLAALILEFSSGRIKAH